ncbi:MAG: ATP-binding protein [Legionellales bacterium]|jgi:predicted AAA+ superfamily ATPase
MYNRLLNIDPESTQSVFLFGPRGTGKTSWVRSHFIDALYIDLLNTGTYNTLLAAPNRLESMIPPSFKNWIIIDEVQKIPELLNEVHRLIEHQKFKFILTGSSARSLRRRGTNLLAGRALKYTMYPFVCQELQQDFNLLHALKYGLLPNVINNSDPALYLETYVTTYLREEILQEGITRNLSEFARFLEVASFSQGNILNMSNVAREAAIAQKTVVAYFDIVEDLLLGMKIPVFTRRAQRQLVSHPKFYFFDVGIYRTIRPRGILDTDDEIDGAGLETLVLQHLLAINDYYRFGYQIYFWRTRNNVEVDFILYGEHGLHAFEIKRKTKLDHKDFSGLKAFAKDYPMAQLTLIYGGSETLYVDSIKIIPLEQALFALPQILQEKQTS